jgi:hypothetical protein
MNLFDYFRGWWCEWVGLGCDKCQGVSCPPASNFCKIAGTCTDGTCSAEVNKPNRTVCQHAHDLSQNICMNDTANCIDGTCVRENKPDGSYCLTWQDVDGYKQLATGTCITGNCSASPAPQPPSPSPLPRGQLEWFLGEEGDSCTRACSRNNMICSEENWSTVDVFDTMPQLDVLGNDLRTLCTNTPVGAEGYGDIMWDTEGKPPARLAPYLIASGECYYRADMTGLPPSPLWSEMGETPPPQSPGTQDLPLCVGSGTGLPTGVRRFCKCEAT